MQNRKVDNYKDFQVIKAAKGAGFGLRTLVPFKEDDPVIEYVGIIERNSDLDEHQGRYLFEINDNFTIDGSPRWNLARYINHSCDPNCEVEIADEEERVIIHAIRDIEAGEEITYDYGDEYFKDIILKDPHGCLCSKCVAKKQKKKVKSQKKIK